MIPRRSIAEEPVYTHDLTIFVAMMWDRGWALESIAQRMGIPAARCCKIAKEYWASRPGENKRPLVEEIP